MSRLLFLLFCVLQTLVSANSDPDGEITRILQKLNSNPDAEKVYNRADLIYAEFKADRTEKEVGVLVKFQGKGCEGECEEGSEICKGLFEGGELTDVSCLPAADRSIEQQPGVSVDTPPEVPEEAINPQACVGCSFDLNKNVEGLDELLNTALKHVESERANKHVVVNVLRVQQQIVAGVKYILLVEIAPTTCLKDDRTSKNCPPLNNAPTEICQIEFLQQPWISKSKSIISNNCTYTQEFVEVPQRNSRENEIAGSGGNRNRKSGFVDERFSDADSESNNDWLAELESQILIENGGEADEEVPSVRPLVKRVDNAATLDSEVKSYADGFFGNNEAETTTDSEKVTETTEFFTTSILPAEKISFEDHEEANTAQENFDADDSSEEEKKVRKQRIDPENKSVSLSSEEVQKNDDLDKRFIRSASDSSSVSSKSAESLERSNSNSDSSEEQKRKEYRAVRSASDSTSSSKSAESLEKSSSNSDGSEEQTRKEKRSTTPLEKITPEEKPLVRHLADFAASTLDNIDDDNHKRIVLQILGAKKMKMQGTLYHLTMRIGVSHCFEDEYDESCKDKLIENLTKICKVQVHVSEDQFSHRVLKSQCQTIKKDNSDINRTTHNRFRRGLLGGKRKIPTDDPQINDLLLTSLSSVEAQLNSENKLKPVEIISADRQTVAGYLYTIKARLAPSTCTQNSVTPVTECELLKDADSKVCEFTILQRLWLKTPPEVKVTCDDSPARLKREIISDSFEKYEKPDFDAEFLFKRFVRMHKKMYSSYREFKQRFKVFKRNLKHIQFLNSNEQGTARYGITKFADLTRKEFAQQYLGYRPDLASENEIPFPQAKIPDVELPPSFDWRDKGAVSEVKDQGMCGSCWAFSVTGNVEGQYAIKYGKLQEFSEQELVDCDKLDEGCNGGLMDNAYRAIEKLGGLETERDYPYDGENERCHFNKSLSRVQLSGAVNISHNETDMAKWLVQNGPISIAINANAMQFYMGGVSHPLKFLCSPDNLDHGVLIVGYGVHKYPYFKKQLPYWIVKNSWGTSWGEQGYYRVYRGDGTCGLNQTPSSAIVA